MAAYALSIQTAPDLPEDNYYEYTLQIQNFDTGEVLFDEPIQTYCIQSSCMGLGMPRNVLGCKLPSEWFIRKNERIVCTLRAFAGSTTESYFVTLIGREVISGDPNPAKKPFFYTFPMNLGFQDNANASGQTSVNFNQQVCNTMAKHMLHDFELISIVLDPWGTQGLTAGAAGTPFWSLQVELPNSHKLFERMIINGCVGGGTNFGQGDSVDNPTVTDAFFDDEVWQYVLPQPEIVRKRQLIRVDISPAVTYVASNLMHFTYNQQVCMALVGNHLYS